MTFSTAAENFFFLLGADTCLMARGWSGFCMKPFSAPTLGKKGKTCPDRGRMQRRNEKGRVETGARGAWTGFFGVGTEIAGT